MTADKPLARFLVRGSALLILLLVFWWFLLLNPLLFLLRDSAEIFGSLILGDDSRQFVTETPSGDWSFRVPLEVAMPPIERAAMPLALEQVPLPGVVAPRLPQQSGPLQIHSIDFDIARSDVNAFTFSLPVFWAIVLAAPGIRRSLRPLIFGTILVAILEIVLLLIFVEISARNAAAQLAPQSGWTKWFLHFGEYLVVNVIPYAAPFPIALSVHRELRSQFFRWGEGTPIPGGRRPGLQSGAARNGRPRSKKQRRRDMGPARQS
jgi:hypothetical protein